MRPPLRSVSWLSSTPPTVAIEIASRRVTVVALGARESIVSAYASQPLPEGAVAPAPVGVNIAQADVVVSALKRALEQAGLTSTKRAALVVPDSVARVSLLHFDQAPARAQELDEIVRWQLKKATPYPLEEALITHAQSTTDATGLSVAAVVARRDVLAQYEAVAAAVGIHAGIVDLASIDVMNAIIAAGAAVPGDWLLVHLAAEATTMAILRGGTLMFYRHRTAVDDETLSGLVHQTAMYHEDRLGGRAFERAWLCGAAAAAPGTPGDNDASGQISKRLGIPVERVDVRPAADVRDRAATTPDVLDALAAPVGLLIRERRSAA
jgi:Tfp pilus assembly PilM family ATPase